MNGNAFIRMMREDIETHKNKKILSSVVDVMEYVVAQHPDCDIPSNKNAEDCYQAIFEGAKRNTGTTEGNTWCVSTPEQSILAVSEYLGLTTGKAYVPQQQATAPAVGGGTISLEDFL